MAQKMGELRVRMSREALARSSAHAEAMLLERGLPELRKNRHNTQVELASVLKIDQVAASKTAGLRSGTSCT